MKDMILEINNFGPINKAKIDIGKINVVAGQNDSGKTISSKIFYCLLASASSDVNYLVDKGILERLMPLIQDLARIIDKDYPLYSEKLRELFVVLLVPTRVNKPLKSTKEIYDEIIEIFEPLDFENKNFYKDKLDKIKELIEVKNDTSILIPTMNTLLNIEFGGRQQIFSVFNGGSFSFFGKHEDCEFGNKIQISDGEVLGTVSENYLNCINVNEISYLETPYILDFTVSEYPLGNLAMNFFMEDNFFINANYHQRLLIQKLFDTSSEEDIYDSITHENVINFSKKIKKIIEGQIKFNSKTTEFMFEKGTESFSLKNTSAGIKQLGIIQLLLDNRKLTENSYLIMDEPEVHLHPEWQIKLAEIIVLLAKDLNITLYINSHSPQFIEAIQVYSEFHNIKECANFYLTVKDEETGKFNFKKIDNNELQLIYKNLGDPYDIIDKVIGLNLVNNFKGRD